MLEEIGKINTFGLDIIGRLKNFEFSIRTLDCKRSVSR